MTMEKTKFTTDLEALTLVVERTFDAPRDLVFKAWSEPERIAQWWGPRGWATTNYAMDFRPGGVWHYCMSRPDGMESWGRAVYQEIVVPERIVYVDSFSDARGNAVPGAPEMVITLEFADVAGKTKLTSCTKFASRKDMESILDMGVVQGLTETWDRLEEYLASLT
jgi:uncharacterized protein YndB with AHSA1/START domain